MRTRSPGMLGDNRSSYPSAGLDQLGPKHWQGDGLVLKRNKRVQSIGQRSAKSTGGRGVKITLPPVSLPPEPED